jgi:ABC-type Fe3+/spermidine/putrescine transport system ATPase subunit
MPEEGKLVELVGVRKAFGDNVVLDGIDLGIGRGEAIVVAGPSGSGKSTMLRCVNGLEGIDAGSISFDGLVVSARGVGGRLRVPGRVVAALPALSALVIIGAGGLLTAQAVPQIV